MEKWPSLAVYRKGVDSYKRKHPRHLTRRTSDTNQNPGHGIRWPIVEYHVTAVELQQGGPLGSVRKDPARSTWPIGIMPYISVGTVSPIIARPNPDVAVRWEFQRNTGIRQPIPTLPAALIVILV